MLDLGCAAGYLSEILAERGYAGHLHRLARHAAPRHRGVFGRRSGRRPGAGGRYFDYIICADIIEHLRDPLRLLKECRERLAPGGTLVASLPNSAHWYFRWNILMGRFPQHERGLFDSTHLHFYTWDGWVRLFERAGFRIETVRCLVGSLWTGRSGLGRVGPRALLERLSVAVRADRKTLFAYQFIVARRAPKR